MPSPEAFCSRSTHLQSGLLYSSRREDSCIWGTNPACEGHLGASGHEERLSCLWTPNSLNHVGATATAEGLSYFRTLGHGRKNVMNQRIEPEVFDPKYPSSGSVKGFLL